MNLPKIRRIRVAKCPHCNHTVPLDRKPPSRKDTLQQDAITVCINCIMVFKNGDVDSWLLDID